MEAENGESAQSLDGDVPSHQAMILGILHPDEHPP